MGRLRDLSEFAFRSAAAWRPVVLLLSTAFFAADATAATGASTRIINIANLQLSTGNGLQSIASNQVDLIVGESLDVVLAVTRVEAIGQTETVSSVPFSLTNTGNGEEAFDLGGSQAFAIDVDGDGRFDPARDRLLDAGRTPVLTSGASLALLAIIDPNVRSSDGVLTITARCLTGTGAPGTVFAGKGDGGSDAVVGASGGEAKLALPFRGTALPPSLVKSQSVRATDGSSAPSSGAIVTYVLEARFPGPAAAARIVDPIPAGTVYLPGSLQLDGVALPDADRSAIAAGAIDVALGDITAPISRVVQFKVIIQ